MKFKYKVQDKNNKIIEGERESTDKFSLSRDLRNEGYTPISIQEDKGSKFFLKKNLFSRVSLSEKIIFANNLSGMISAGVVMTRALLILEKQTTNPALKKILNSLVEDINSGLELSEAMKKFPKVFSGVFVPMTRAGEESGKLADVLLEIGRNLKKTYELNRKIKGALTYPTIIMIAMVLIGIFMMAYVVPTLTKTFKELEAELPSTTKIVIWLSDVISNHVFFFLFGVFFIVGSIFFLAKLKLTKRYFDYVILKIPAIGKIVIEVNTARTARIMSSLIISGVSTPKALSITEDVLQNFYYKQVIKRAIVLIEKGSKVSEAFKENISLYPVMMGEMMEVGEETGNFSKMLTDIADFYEGEVDSKTKNLSTIIEPVLMLFIGGAVGFFAVSMLTPMYSVMSQIK